MQNERTCQRCGNKFIGGNSAIYCYDCKEERYKESKNRYMARRDKGIKLEKKVPEKDLDKTCKNCGKIFHSPQKTAKYCCPECVVEYSKKNKVGMYGRPL